MQTDNMQTDNMQTDNMQRDFKFDDHQGIKKMLQDNGFRHDQEMVKAVLSRCTPTVPYSGVYTAQEIFASAPHAEAFLSEQARACYIVVED